MSAIKQDFHEIASGTIQRLLYEKPLFNYIDHNNVNIIVFGFTLFCQRFIDIAFEVAQVNGYKLNITVVSEKADAKEQFLTARPAFAQFFDVDNSESDCSYGCLSFVLKSFDGNIEDTVSDIFLNEEAKYAYLFIDTGNDVVNVSIASACSICGELLFHSPIINCVLTEHQTLDNNIEVVDRGETIQNHKDYPKLRRMALNCHLLWNDSAFLDIRKLQRQFNAEYNFSSSLSSVLAIQYKLNSVGIDIHDVAVAQQFYQLVTATNAESKQKIA